MFMIIFATFLWCHNYYFTTLSVNVNVIDLL